MVVRAFQRDSLEFQGCYKGFKGFISGSLKGFQERFKRSHGVLVVLCARDVSGRFREVPVCFRDFLGSFWSAPEGFIGFQGFSDAV